MIRTEDRACPASILDQDLVARRSRDRITLSDWRWLSPGAQVAAVLLGGLIVGLELCITPDLMIWALAFGGLVAGLQMVSALCPRGTR